MTKEEYQKLQGEYKAINLSPNMDDNDCGSLEEERDWLEAQLYRLDKISRHALEVLKDYVPE
jgi:hypothetical protein